MAPRTTYGGLSDGLQPLSQFDQSLADMGKLGIIPCTASGTNAVVLTQVASAFAPTITAYANYLTFAFVPAATSTGLVTIAAPGLAALPLYRQDGVTQATTGDLVIGVLTIVSVNMALHSSAGGFVKTGAGAIAAGPTAHQWVNAINADGTATLSQPAFSDISGSVAPAQLPNPSASTLGGIESVAAVSHNWINSISTSGVPALSQPAFADISGTIGASQFVATNNNISQGTSAGSSLTSSPSNVLIGINAGKNITSGTGENVIIGGASAGITMTTGTQNTIVGSEAGGAITSDTGHTLVGFQAGLALNGAAQTWNTFVGHAAGRNATGAGGCVAFGRAAGNGFLNDVDCVALGHASFFNNNGGVCTAVTAIGDVAAGADVATGSANWQGSGLTYFGAINDTGVLYIGDQSGKSTVDARTNASAFGHLARLTKKDNVIVLGHGVTDVSSAGRLWGGFTRGNLNTGASTTVTGATFTAAILNSGYLVWSGTPAGGVAVTTDTAANIVAAGPGTNCEVCSQIVYIQNLTGQTLTLTGGTGVTIGGTTTITTGTFSQWFIFITNGQSGSEAVTLQRGAT